MRRGEVTEFDIVAVRTNCPEQDRYLEVDVDGVRGGVGSVGSLAWYF